MLNKIFVAICLSAILLAGYNGRMSELTLAMLEDAKKAVELAINLVGVMAFFLGLMRVVEEAGLLKLLSRAAAPLMRRLFPSVPADHPAMSAMLLNIGSNMMGLTNAATPFGIRAMEELNKLNGKQGTATNAMVLFLAMNTSGLALLPSGVMGLRASVGSQDPAGIMATTWFASGCATIVGITVALTLSRLPRFRKTEPPAIRSEATDSDLPSADDLTSSDFVEEAPRGPWRQLIVAGFLLTFLAFLVLHARKLYGTVPTRELVQELLSQWVLAAIVAGGVLYGWARGVRVYDALVEGAKQGFQVALRIIPYLVAILVAVGMLRAAGGIELLSGVIDPWTSRIGLPAEALPVAFLRPLTGTGGFGVMAEIMTQHGADSFLGYLVSTMQGSTDTTFYVLAVYFGAVGIRDTRHALPSCLAADLTGILAAILIVTLLFG